jgi:hypothetical protein
LRWPRNRFWLIKSGHELQRYGRSIAQLLTVVEQVPGEMQGLQRGHAGITVASTANYSGPRLRATFRMPHAGVSVSLDNINREGLIRRKRAISSSLIRALVVTEC